MKHSRRLTRKRTRSRRQAGGFLPSIMGPFAARAAVFLPAAILTGVRMVRDWKRPRRVATRRRAH